MFRLMRVLGLITLAVFATTFVTPLLKGFTAVAWIIASVIFIGAAMYLGVMVLANPKLTEPMLQYFVCDRNLGFVPLFADEPAPGALECLGDPAEANQLVLAQQVKRVDNDTEIVVLDDSREDVVHVRIVQGLHRGHDGWIPRKNLESRQDA